MKDILPRCQYRHVPHNYNNRSQRMFIVDRQITSRQITRMCSTIHGIKHPTVHD